jgi:hypothetical protein
MLIPPSEFFYSGFLALGFLKTCPFIAFTSSSGIG